MLETIATSAEYAPYVQHVYFDGVRLTERDLKRLSSECQPEACRKVPPRLENTGQVEAGKVGSKLSNQSSGCLA